MQKQKQKKIHGKPNPKTMKLYGDSNTSLMGQPSFAPYTQKENCSSVYDNAWAS